MHIWCIFLVQQAVGKKFCLKFWLWLFSWSQMVTEELYTNNERPRQEHKTRILNDEFSWCKSHKNVENCCPFADFQGRLPTKLPLLFQLCWLCPATWLGIKNTVKARSNFFLIPGSDNKSATKLIKPVFNNDLIPTFESQADRHQVPTGQYVYKPLSLNFGHNFWRNVVE